MNSRFLVNFANSTSEEHQKLLTQKFKDALKSADLNNKLGKNPNTFSVNMNDLLKLINFQENRWLTVNENKKATKYMQNIKDILHVKSLKQNDNGEISFFLKEIGITSKRF